MTSEACKQIKYHTNDNSVRLFSRCTLCVKHMLNTCLKKRMPNICIIHVHMSYTYAFFMCQTCVLFLIIQTCHKHLFTYIWTFFLCSSLNVHFTNSNIHLAMIFERGWTVHRYSMKSFTTFLQWYLKFHYLTCRILLFYRVLDNIDYFVRIFWSIYWPVNMRKLLSGQ